MNIPDLHKTKSKINHDKNIDLDFKNDKNQLNNFTNKYFEGDCIKQPTQNKNIEELDVDIDFI